MVRTANKKRLALAVFLILLAVEMHNAAADQASSSNAQARNVVVIVSDDHRYDFMGFMPGGPAFLETPNMDRMAREGAHLSETSAVV